MSNEITASLKNVSLEYKLNYYATKSIRDIFVSPFKKKKTLENVHLALDNIDLDINKGDIIGVLGKNGSGKTSLCQSIAGMIKPNVGDIQINGNVLPIFNTSIGVYQHLTGAENALILANLLYPNFSDTKINQIVEVAKEFSGLEHFLDIPYENYSTGMKIRLCLSIITSSPSDLIIFDEVYDGADENFKIKIKNRIHELIDKSKSVLFVSHQLDHIKQICNKAIIMDKGKIIFNGEVEKAIKIYSSFFN